jgi:CheY-like chemotaxis protein
LLRKAVAEVTVVENGREALEAALAALAAKKPFDIILMDMQMPVMDGDEATVSLRAGGYAGTIVALTAHAKASDRDKCLRAGCDEYFAKPIDRSRFFEMLTRFFKSPRPAGINPPAAGQD